MELLKLVGFGCCPADALPVVKENAKLITTAKGGEGAIREVVDMILKMEMETCKNV